MSCRYHAPSLGRVRAVAAGWRLNRWTRLDGLHLWLGRMWCLRYGDIPGRYRTSHRYDWLKRSHSIGFRLSIRTCDAGSDGKTEEAEVVRPDHVASQFRTIKRTEARRPVGHSTFGVGKVVSVEGDKVTVRFQTAGTKIVLESYIKPR